MEAKHFKALKRFFTISVAGFSFIEAILEATGKPLTLKHIEIKRLYQEGIILLEATNLEDPENILASEIQLNILINQIEIVMSQLNIQTKKTEQGGVSIRVDSGEVLIKK